MLKRNIGQLVQLPYRVTASWRQLPDFLLIGAQKSGTTSLFNYLSQHPGVARNPRNRKEMYFFNRDYARGMHFYRQYFPLKSVGGLVGEGSTVYLSSQGVPRRVAQMLPEVKILAVLREPAARAISHYFHHVQRGRETRSIEEAFSSEILEMYTRGELLDGLSYRYLSNGDYAKHLKRWLLCIDERHFCVLQAETLFSQPQVVYDQVCDFLGLTRRGLVTPQVLNVGVGKQEYPEVKARLERFYKPLVLEFSKCSLINFSWNEYQQL
jgi:hypothetical protein